MDFFLLQRSSFIVKIPTQPNITEVGFDIKMTLLHHQNPLTTTGNSVVKIQAFTHPILTKL